MIKLFLFLFTISNFKPELQENYFKKNAGDDTRHKSENIETKIKIIENLYKGQLVEKLQDDYKNIDEKIKLIEESNFLIENMFLKFRNILLLKRLFFQNLISIYTY